MIINVTRADIAKSKVDENYTRGSSCAIVEAMEKKGLGNANAWYDSVNWVGGRASTTPKVENWQRKFVAKGTALPISFSLTEKDDTWVMKDIIKRRKK